MATEACPSIRDTFTTGGHFSVSHLDVVEAVVLAVVEANAPPQAVR